MIFPEDYTNVSVEKFELFLSSLSTLENKADEVPAAPGYDYVRAIHSSGGAAGGVVSEGQGYGVLLAGAHAIRDSQYLETGYELYLGWKQMAVLSETNTCQDVSEMSQIDPNISLACGDGEFVCLPGWKFNDPINSEIGTGSASDGDIDAVLGLVLLTIAGDIHGAETDRSMVARYC